MDNDCDRTQSAFPTPQSAIMSHHEGSQDLHDDVKYRADSAIWSVLKNSNTNDMLRTPTFEDRHIKALVSLSGSLLSMLVQFGDDSVWGQTNLDLADFVLDTMDACADRKQAKELAAFLFKHIQGSTSITTNTTVEHEATLITPEENMEDKIESKEEEQGTVACSVLPAKQRVSRPEHNPPPIDYDPLPIAKLGARFVSDLFGSDACPETVVNYTPTLSEYICDVISKARVERPVAIYALALLNRLSARRRVSVPHGTFGLFITAYTIAGKMLGDNPYSNNSWCIAGQKLFTLEELNEMERKMCGDLMWELDIGVDELKNVEEKIQECYDGGISHVWPRMPTPSPLGTPASVAEQTSIFPTPSIPLVTPYNCQVQRGDFTPAAPQTSTSSDSFFRFGVDSSPRWVTPTPSELRSISADQEKWSNNNKQLIWVEYDMTDYESEGYEGSEGNTEDEEIEDSEMSDPDVF
ncbi:unnamed protein product [Rhizoctonia solani]|uniref:Cyclin N-terminal domain-containing protein n=1 Tax=Rhizoctonia solani TaxID=456999 RepID=A0A8H2X062_9AGAM|nr:unnamed protein product [Rhizoctonia solani]